MGMDTELLARLALTIAAAMLGGYTALKLRVPAGALIGSMLVVAVLNVAFGTTYMPVSWKFFTQVSTGAYLGAKMSRADLGRLKLILKPAAILALVMIAVTVAVGVLICRVSDLTPATALFGVAPAGITDMTLASMDFDSEPSIVALIQTVRIVFTVCFLPLVIRVIERRTGVPVQAKAPAAAKESAPGRKKKSVGEIAVTLLIALVCGRVGKLLGIPAGAITCSMVGAAAFNLLTDHAYMPLRLRQFIQVFAGALIGCTVGRAQVLQMLRIWQVILIAIAGFMLLDLVAAWIIHRHTEMDVVTALFSSAPGGLTDMALIAEDMGADSVKIAGMHMLRLMGVVILYPSIIGLLIRFLN